MSQKKDFRNILDVFKNIIPRKISFFKQSFKSIMFESKIKKKADKFYNNFKN